MTRKSAKHLVERKIMRIFAPEKSNKVSEYEKDLCFTSTFDA